MILVVIQWIKTRKTYAQIKTGSLLERLGIFKLACLQQCSFHASISGKGLSEEINFPYFNTLYNAPVVIILQLMGKSLCILITATSVGTTVLKGYCLIQLRGVA